jgi:anthranilate/para-aminobenzoate synthase component I
VKLSEIERLPSFALLGPGFSGADFVLVAPLAAAENPRVLFVTYEAEGRAHQGFDGPVERGPLTMDVEAQALEVTLNEAGHAEGVVYQVNLTLRARIAACSGARLFATLCERGLPRFAAWVRLPDGTEFVSASPELFFEVDQRRIRCEPMKGTAAHDATEALEHSEKDAAELAMITDLIRNDLTPVCEPRSVQVTCERRFLSLPYAVQGVSDIEGVLLSGVSLSDVLAALHPGGSITGAPKAAARAFIDRLEPSPRGAYCGTLGWVDGPCATFSLLIRTARRVGLDWVYGVGGGIVWDSDAAKELDEARLKLGALR